MSNHYHLVLYVDQRRAQELSQREIADRWTRLYETPRAVKRYFDGEAGEAESDLARAMISLWRSRFHDISWSMLKPCSCISSVRAIHGGQALDDEAGLLTAMAYVDPNPFAQVSPERRRF